MKALKGKVISFLVLIILILSTTTYVYADVATPPASVAGVSVLIIAAVIVAVGFVIPYLLRKIHNKK